MLATTVADAAVGFAVLAGRAPDALAEPQPAADGGRRCAARCRGAPGRAQPGGGRRRRPAAGRRRPRHGRRPTRRTRPGWACAGIATWFAAAYRGRRGGRDRPARAAAAYPPARRARASGRGGAGWSGSATATAWRERCHGLVPDGSVDLLLTPALAGAAAAGRQWSRRSWRANMLANLRYAPYAAPWNVAGLPADRGAGRACARTACRSACNWSARPVAELLLLGASPGSWSWPRPWPRRHASRPVARGAPGVTCSRRRGGWHDRGMTDWSSLADVRRPGTCSPGSSGPRRWSRAGRSTAALGGPAWLKCENLQRAGSFKVRGAYVRIARLSRGGAGPRRGRGQRRQPRPGRGARRRAARHRRPRSSCRSARRCRRWRRPRGTARQVELVGSTVDEALVAAQEFAERTGAVLHPPVRPSGRHRRPGHGRRWRSSSSARTCAPSWPASAAAG